MNDQTPFVWGVATSSYQIEGAWDQEGRAPSIWDDFCRVPGKTRSATGDFAGDHYHRWRDDVALMKEMGVKAYRFSISWSRIFPDGTGNINETGARFYDTLIDALLEANITPWVTIYHWDLPSALQTKFGGWMSHETIEAFWHYSDCCFARYGNRVKNWITLNEPCSVTDSAPMRPDGKAKPSHGSSVTISSSPTRRQSGFIGKNMRRNKRDRSAWS